MIVLKLTAVVILLLILINKKVNLGISLVIASIAMVLLNGQGPADFLQALVTTVKEPLTYTMTFTILFISIMGYLMNRYHMLDRMIEHLEQILRSAKATILLAPTIIGLLLVTGGALMSCPVVDKLGEKLKLPNDKRAAINMIFRHGLYFAYPLSTNMILAAELGGFNIFNFIRLTFPLTIVMFILGYFCLLKNVKDERPAKVSKSEYIGHIGGFLVHSSPITVSIILTVILGLPFHYTLPVGILTAIVVNFFDSKKNPQYAVPENPLALVVKGINMKTLYAIWGTLLFKSVIGNTSELADFVSQMVKTGVPVELIVLVGVGILSFAMGNFQSSLAIIFPLIIPLASSQYEVMVFGYLMYAVGFLAYFTSPIHMCQILTLDYFKTSMKELYANYKVFLPLLVVALIVWYFVLKMGVPA